MHQELIKQCGYTGMVGIDSDLFAMVLHLLIDPGQMPFWEWGIDAASDRPLRDSELFNGDAYSMGSDGEFIPGRIDPTFVFPDGSNLTLEAGTGGGPVFSGPFKNYTVNLGPFLIPYTHNVASNYEYNPRPLTRSLRLSVNQKYVSYANYTPVLLQAETPYDFQTLTDGDVRNPANNNPRQPFRAHGGGHSVMGGDPSDDFFTSPGDPMFWLQYECSPVPGSL
jgi:tyrosinase